MNSANKIYTIIIAYILELALQIIKINVITQKIDRFSLQTFEKIINAF